MVRTKLPVKKLTAAEGTRPILRVHVPDSADPGPYLAEGADQAIITVPADLARLPESTIDERIILAIPPFVGNDHLTLIEDAVDRFSGLCGGFMAGDLGTLAILGELLEDEREKVFADHWLNVFNAHALRALVPACGRVCLSQELSLGQTARMAARRPSEVTELELVVGGHQQVMVTANCVLDGALSDCRAHHGGCARAFELADRTGRRLPVRTDGFCRSHVFNAYPTVVADRLEVVLPTGLDVLRLDLRAMPRAEGLALLATYRQAVDGAQVPPPPPETFTRGHLFRPVL